MPKCNASFGEIVGGEFERDLIARQNADAIAPQAARKVREDNALVFELNTEETTRKFFENGPGNFDTVFLAHSTSSMASNAGSPHTGGPPESEAALTRDHYSAETFEACKPFGPVVTSNSTRAPSSSER